jgi:predicted dehydrogenase
VLVEKPMAHSLQACDAMLEAATKNNRVLMMAYMKRYDPAYEHAQTLVANMKDLLHVSAHDFIGPNSGFVADIHEVRVFRDAPSNDGEQIHNRRLQEALGTFTDKAKDLYGWLTGLSTHDLAILRGLFGSPKRIVAAIQSRNAHVFHALLEYEQGMTGILEYGFMPHLKKFDQVLGVYSASQVVKVLFPSPYIPFAATQVQIWEPDGPGKADRPDRPNLPEGGGGRGIRESLVIPSYDESFRRELQHFAHCIRTGATPRTPGIDGRDDVRLCIELAKAAFP